MLQPRMTCWCNPGEVRCTGETNAFKLKSETILIIGLVRPIIEFGLGYM